MSNVTKKMYPASVKNFTKGFGLIWGGPTLRKWSEEDQVVRRNPLEDINCMVLSCVNLASHFSLSAYFSLRRRSRTGSQASQEEVGCQLVAVTPREEKGAQASPPHFLPFITQR